jgi:hypothetical protein
MSVGPNEGRIDLPSPNSSNTQWNLFIRIEKVPVLFKNGKCFRQEYFSQNYWVFGLFASSGILENRKHDVSETGSVSVLR